MNRRSRFGFHLPSLAELLCISVITILANPGAVSAHELRPCLLEISEIGTSYYAIHWVASAPSDGSETPFPVFPAHCRGAEPRDSGPPRFLQCGPEGLAGKVITIRGLARSRVEAVVRYSTIHRGTTTYVLRADAPEFITPNESGEQRSRAALASEYLHAGIEHILFGWDHLLFVLGLIFLVPKLKSLVRTITAFTLAHSITLALAASGVVQIAQAPTEALIALSLALLATEIAKPAEEAPLARRRPWIMAFTFGLLHGFGFAGALSALGLPDGEMPIALFTFNIGVELGQIAFVIAVLGIIAILKRGLPHSQQEPNAPLSRWSPRIVAYGIGVLSMSWFFERLTKLAS